MQHTSLFGHLATRFSAHPENLATEALNYILNRSSVAKQALIRYIAQSDVALTSDLVLQTQMSGADSATPDLVGVDADGQRVLIIEAKFWAGLTGNQPVAYLDQLPGEVDSILMFVAPAMRFPTLWNEFLRRCNDARLTISQRPKLGAEFLLATVNEKQVLALVSWRSMLSFLLRALEAEGQIGPAADVMQLQGLCERMDDDAFLPLRPDELTSGIGTRVTQLCQIVNEVTNIAVAEGFASTEGLRASASLGWYGRYMKLYGHGCLLQFNAAHWAHLSETPLWLSVTDSEWQATLPFKEALSSFELEQPPRLLVANNELLVPLHLPFGVEKHHVVDALVAQLREIAELLRGHDQPLASTDGSLE